MKYKVGDAVGHSGNKDGEAWSGTIIQTEEVQDEGQLVTIFFSDKDSPEGQEKHVFAKHLTEWLEEDDGSYHSTH